MYPTKHKFQWLVQVQHNNFDSPSILGNTTQLPVMNILQLAGSRPMWEASD